MNITAGAAKIAADASLRNDQVASTGANSRTAALDAAAPDQPSSATQRTGAQAKTDAGPAAKVTISSKARAAMKAAGVDQTEIARTNLADKNAVSRAIQRARASHGKPAPTAAKASLSSAEGAAAREAVQDRAAVASNELEVDQSKRAEGSKRTDSAAEAGK